MKGSFLSGMDHFAGEMPDGVSALDAHFVTRRISLLPAAIGLLILILISLGSVYAVIAARTESDLLEKLLIGRTRLTSFTKSMLDLEIGELGFVSTGNEKFVTTYDRALSDLPIFESAIRQSLVTAEDKAVYAELEGLKTSIIADFSAVLELARSGDRNEALRRIAEGHGRELMQSLRGLTDNWRTANATRIAEVRTNAQRAQTTAVATIITGCILVVMLGLFWLRDTRRYLRVILDLVDRLRQAAGSLAVGVEQRSRDLDVKSRELEAALARFELATKTGNITVFEQDRDRRYKWVSRGTKDKSPEEIVGLREEDVLPPDSIPETLALKNKAFMTGEPVRGDIFGSRDGRGIWWHVRVFPLFENGEVSGLIGTSMSITEQKKISILVEERGTRLEIATKAAAFGVFEWDPKTDSAVWDDRLYEIFGRSPTEGPVTLDEFLHAIVHSDDMESFKGALAAGFKTGSLEKHECRIRRSDGSAGWVRFSARFGVETPGKAALTVGVVEDITAEKLGIIELAKTHSLIKALTNSTPDLIFAKDRAGRMIFANPATLKAIGKPWAELEGRTDLEWHDKPDEAENNLVNDRRVIETGRPEVIEETFTAGEAPATFLSTKSPLYDSTGAIIGIVGVSTDISERKANDEQRQFLMREVTHRSKNLLAVVQSMARQTATMSASLDDFQGRFSARLQGLATSHDLLLQEDWRGASIRQLVISQLGHLIDLIDSRILVTGPDGLLHPDAAQNIGLALHELSTNASKYGALSNETGRVYIRWGLLPGGPDGEQFFINWQEDGGPPVSPPTRKGFGHSVMQRLVARSLDGTVDLAFNPEGVVWRLEIPRGHVMKMRDLEEGAEPGVASTDIAEPA